MKNVYFFIILIKQALNKDKYHYVITIYFQKKVYMNEMNLIYYDRIDVSEEIGVNKTSKSRECIVCRYRYYVSK